MSRRALALGAALVAACALLAQGVWLPGSFHYDDFHSLVWNPHVRDLGNVARFFTDPSLFSSDPAKAMYRPLLLVTYALNYAMGGYDPTAYRLVNLALHVGCALLVGWAGLELGLGGRRSLAAALLFAVHPLAAEPVNYVSSRSESLATLFYLTGMGCFLRGTRRGPGWAWALSPAAFALALLSKSTAITLPAVLLLADRLLPRPAAKVAARRSAASLAAMALVALGYLAVTWANGFLSGAARLAAAGAVRPLHVQLLTQLAAVPRYLALLAVPVHLNVEHQFFEQNRLLAAAPLAALILVLSGAATAFWAWRARRRVLLLLAGWAALASLPTAVVPLNVLVNERRLYLVLVPFCLGLARLLVDRWGWRQARWLPAVGVGLCLAALAHGRCGEWRDEISLWTASVRRAPAMPRAYVHLGNALRATGRVDEARRAFEAALRLEPRHRAARTNLANLYFEAAGTDAARSAEHLTAAAEQYRAVLELDPDHREALNNLGSSLLNLGRADEARRVLERLVQRYPNFAEGHYNLGLAAGRLSDPGAEAHFRRALELHPDGATWQELGNLQVARGRLAEASDSYRRAIALGPEDAASVYNLAQVLLALGERDLESGDTAGGLGRWAEARQLLRRVLQLQPQHSGAAQRLRQLEARLP